MAIIFPDDPLEAVIGGRDPSEFDCDMAVPGTPDP